MPSDFRKVSTEADFPAIEREILDFWRRSASPSGRLSQEIAVAAFRLMRFTKETHLQSTVRANSIEDEDDDEYEDD